MFVSSFEPRRRGAGFVRAALVGGLLALSFAAAQAQTTTKVVTANSSNNQLSLINFDAAPNVTPLNFDANERKSLQGIVIRDDFAGGTNLIVADAQAGEVCLYVDGGVYPDAAGRCQLIGSPTLSAGPQLPSALALNPAGDLFALTSGAGNAVSKTAEIWAYRSGCTGPGCRPGGYADPVRIAGPMSVNLTPGAATATLVPLEILEEARVVNGGTQSNVAQGDLLVLSAKPAALIRLPGRGSAPFGPPVSLPAPYVVPAADVLIYPGSASVAAGRKFPAGVEPGGFAFAPNGDLLVTTNGGDVLIYDTTGQRRTNGVGGFINFAAGLGNGKNKIDVALQRGRYRAFIADRNGGELLRFDFGADGTGTLSGSVAQGVQSPVAVATTTANVVPTLSGTNVQTSATERILTTTFKQVQLDGFTSGNVYLVGDPRPGGNGTFLLSAVNASLPAVEIPSYLQPLPVAPGATEKAFVVIVQATSAAYSGALDVLLDPTLVLGWDPPCTRTDTNGVYVPLAARQRVGWGPIAAFGEQPIPEGPTVINVSVGCGSGRGLTQEASVFIAGTDTRAPAAQTAAGLATLGILLASSDAAAINRTVYRTLSQRHAAAVRKFDRNDYAGTRDELLGLAAAAATVVGAPGLIGPALESRARAAAFAVCTIEGADTVPVCSTP